MISGAVRDILLVGLPPVCGALAGYAAAEAVLAVVHRALGGRRFAARTAAAVRTALAGGEGYELARQIVGRVTGRIAGTSLGALTGAAGGVPGADVGALQAAAGFAGAGTPSILQAVLSSFLGSRAAIHAVRGALSQAVGALLRMPLRDAAHRLGLRQLLEERVLAHAAHPGPRSAAARGISAFLAEAAPDASLARALPEGLRPLLPAAVDTLMEWLGTDAMRRELTARGRLLITDIMEELHVVQRFLITAGQYDRRLDEKMPEIVEKILASLEALARSPENQDRLLETLAAALTAPDGARSGAVREAASTLAERLLAGLEEPPLRARAAAGLESWLTGGAGATVGTLVMRGTGMDEGQIVDRLSASVLEVVTRRGAAAAAAGVAGAALASYAEENAGRTLAQIAGLDASSKEHLDASILRGLGGLAGGLEEALEGVPALVGRQTRVWRGWARGAGAAAGFIAGLAAAAPRLLGV
jgi:hypothetical protein